MTNPYLEKELLRNKKHHAIFTKQTTYDLIDTANFLSNQNETTIDIPIILDKSLFESFKTSPLFGLPYGKNLHNKAWEHFITLLILKTLKDKFQIEPYNLEELLTYFLDFNLGPYLDNIEKFPTRKDLFAIIQSLNLENLRLHFLILYNSISLNREISQYLQDETPFLTMIYSIHDFEPGRIKPDNYRHHHLIKDMFDYMLFQENKRGVHSSHIRKSKIYPDKVKTDKVKKLKR